VVKLHENLVDILPRTQLEVWLGEGYDPCHCWNSGREFKSKFVNCGYFYRVQTKIVPIP